jgi:hypothetical protein
MTERVIFELQVGGEIVRGNASRPIPFPSKSLLKGIGECPVERGGEEVVFGSAVEAREVQNLLAGFGLSYHRAPELVNEASSPHPHQVLREENCGVIEKIDE